MNTSGLAWAPKTFLHSIAHCVANTLTCSMHELGPDNSTKLSV